MKCPVCEGKGENPCYHCDATTFETCLQYYGAGELPDPETPVSRLSNALIRIIDAQNKLAAAQIELEAVLREESKCAS